MPQYDPNFNRVRVRVTRGARAREVYEELQGWLNSAHVPEPDEHGEMTIGIDQAKNTEAADSIRKILDREWPDSVEWIEVEPYTGTLGEHYNR